MQTELPIAQEQFDGMDVGRIQWRINIMDGRKETKMKWLGSKSFIIDNPQSDYFRQLWISAIFCLRLG